MKVKEVNLEETEVSHTLGGAEEGRVQGGEVNLEETEASHTLGGAEEGRVQGGEREGDR
jgi:hypothetical protein